MLLFPAAGLSVSLPAVLVPVPVVCVAISAVLWLTLRFLLARGAARATSGSRTDGPLPFLSRWYSCVTAVLLAEVLALPWAYGYRTTLVQAFKVPTGAMEPTILIGDHLLVVKWAYGWRDPVLGRLLSTSRQPSRGELVVFRSPEDRSRVFIKRCIGLPGETVEVRDGRVLIDGKPLPEPYVRFLEPPLRSVPIESGQPDPGRNWGPQVVPVDTYFVLGDNRDNSRDSRSWGFVPQDDLLGRATVVYWSYEAPREEYHRISLAQWTKDTMLAFARTRWTRIGRRLE